MFISNFGPTSISVLHLMQLSRMVEIDSCKKQFLISDVD